MATVPIGPRLDGKFSAAAELFRQGEVRSAITQYRTVLRFEADAYQRARIYLALTRIYRVSVRMKNAHLELRRAFAAIGLDWPRNSWASLAISYLRPDQMSSLHPDFNRQARSTKVLFIAELYEECGLSAYYLRHIPTLLQAIVRSKRICFELGPSLALLNWYGGAACVVAMGCLRQKSLRLMQHCDEVAQQLTSRAALGKALVWKALLCDYNGQPIHSAEIFEQCFQHYSADLDPVDLRLSAVTLSINYLSRGHYQEALNALATLTSLYPYFRSETGDHWPKDSMAWYTLAPSVMLGHTEEIDKVANAFRSILSADKDEKWLLTLFLGHLLIAGRQTGMEPCKAEDLISRFQVLGMSARGTHLETSFYWIAAAYIRFDFAMQDKGAIDRFAPA